jgi:hypothetical protein
MHGHGTRSGHICGLLLSAFAAREANLLNRERCSVQMKIMMRDEINRHESWEHTGLSLTLMNVAEFWTNEKFVSTTHMQWSPLCTTSETSCVMVLEQVFLRKTQGRALSATAFRELARRFGVFVGLRSPQLVCCQDAVGLVQDSSGNGVGHVRFNFGRIRFHS